MLDLIWVVLFFLLMGLAFVMISLGPMHHQKIRKHLSVDMLGGVVQHEARSLLKIMQKGNRGDKLYLPVRNLVNVVIVYKQMGGDYNQLNTMMETMRLTLASKTRPIHPIRFGGGSGKGFRDWVFYNTQNEAWVEVYHDVNTRTLFHFDETQTNSLGVSKEFETVDINNNN
jgi:hypothetical protein